MWIRYLFLSFALWGESIFDHLGKPWPKHRCEYYNPFYEKPFSQHNSGVATEVKGLFFIEGSQILRVNLDGNIINLYVDEDVRIRKDIHDEILRGNAENIVCFFHKEKDNLYSDITLAFKKKAPYKSRELQDGLSAYFDDKYPRKKRR